MRKYRRFGRRAARKRFSGRRKKTFRYSRRRKRISKLRKRWARKRRNIRRARRRGNWQTFTAKRVNQVSLEIDLNAAPGILAKIAPKPIGNHNNGSNFLTIAKYKSSIPTSNIRLCCSVQRRSLVFLPLCWVPLV
jgi:hypothetical protein